MRSRNELNRTGFPFLRRDLSLRRDEPSSSEQSLGSGLRDPLPLSELSDKTSSSTADKQKKIIDATNFRKLYFDGNSFFTPWQFELLEQLQGVK